MPDKLQITADTPLSELTIDDLKAIWDTMQAQKVPESRGYLDTFATGLKHGVRGLPEAAGRAMQFVDRPGGLPWGDWGQSLVDVTERAREAHPEEKRARELETLSEWHPKRMVRAAGEMIPMSVSAIALGAPVGAGVALAAPTAPLWVPTIAAATAGGAFFGVSAAGQDYELGKQQLSQQAIAAGQDPNTPEIADQIEQTARKAANQTGLIEFIGESVSNIPVFAWMKIGKPAMKQPLKQVLKAPTWKGFMKNMATLFAAEVSTEEGQTILQNITLKKHGVLPDQPWHEGTGEAFGATIILTAFLGGGAHSISEAQRRSTVKALESRNADPKKRLRAAGTVAAQMKAVDPELGEAWFEEAASLISRKLPISTQLEHYVKKPEEIRKEGEGKIEPMASPGGAVKDIAEELTPKPMPEDIPGEIPGIWPKAPAPEPMTSGLSGDELSQMSFEHFQPLMGEVSITEPPMADPLAIQRKAEELLETQQIKLPGFTERGFTIQQETEMQALNDEEAKMERRLDNLNAVPIKTKKIRQMIIEATDRLEQIKTRGNEIQLERLQMLQQAVQARQAEVVPPEPVAPEVVPPPISVEASAPVGMETVITEDQLDDLFDQIAAEEEVGEVPETPTTRTEAGQEAISPEKAGEPTGKVEIVETGAPAAQIGDKGKVEKRKTEKKAKEPWEMIQSEAWTAEQKIATGKHGPDRPGIKWLQWHKGQVQQALASKKPVPPSVLAEYPELKAKPEKAEAPTPKKEKGKAEKKVAVEEKPAEPEIKITGPKKAKEVTVELPEEEAEALKPAEQKKYLLAEIDKAIEAAPEESETVGLRFIITKPREIVKEFAAKQRQIEKEGYRDMPPGREAAKQWTEDNAESYEEELQAAMRRYVKAKRGGYVTIHVPGDGEFRVFNNKTSLKEFKESAKRFPVKVDIATGIRRISGKPTGKRQIGPVAYYNLYQPTKNKLAESPPNLVDGKENATQFYRDGWFSQGHYAINLSPKPKTKHPMLSGTKAPDIKGAIPKGKLKAAKIMGELYDGIVDERATPLVHFKTKDGTEIFARADYVDVVFTHYPDAKPYIKDTESPIVFKIKESPVACVMPMRGPDSGIVLPDELRKRYETLWPEEAEIEPKGEVKLSVEKFKAENFNDRLIKDVFRSAMEEVLPKSLAKMTDIRVAEVIKLNKTALKSLELHGCSEQEAFDIMAGRGPVRVAGMTQFLETGVGFVPLVSFAYDHASFGTVYHEGFHVAMKMVMPEHAVDRVIKHYGNEEEAAKAFADFVLKQKGERAFKHPTWVRRVWDRLIAFSKAIVNGFKKKGLDNVDDVFRALMNKEYARLSRAEVAERIDRAEKEAKLEVSGKKEEPFIGKPEPSGPPPAMPTTPEEADAVIKQYHSDYISSQPAKQRPSLTEAAHSLYQRMVDRIHGIVRKEKMAKKGLQAGDLLELSDAQYEALTPQNKRYYDYIKERQILPPGETPETAISSVYAASAIAGSYISPKRGTEDAIMFTTMEGNIKKLYDKTLETIIKDRNQVDIEAYMTSERDIELSGMLSVYGRKIIGTHPERSRATLEAMRIKYGDKFDEEIQKPVNEIREWQDAVFLRQLVEVGAMSEERYKAIKKRGQKYVTFWRVMDELEQHGEIRASADLFRPGRIPIKVIKGNERQIISPFESMIVMAHRVTQFAQAARFASSVAKLRFTTPHMAELFQERDPKWIPHKVELKEELDPQMVDQITEVAKSLGVTVKTLQSLGGRKCGEFRAYLNDLGVLQEGEIYRRFATSERILSHELGHAIDERFDLKKVLMASPEMKKEIRKVADQRAGEGASSYYLKYIRKREEQVAEFVNRYINNREQARDMAPSVAAAFERFCNEHEELKPVLDIDLSGQAELVPFEATIFTKSPFAPEKDTIMTLEDGKPTYFKVPHDVYLSMENFNYKEMSFLVKVIGAPARLLRAGATMTFEFALGRNPIRDVMSAWVYGHRSGFGFRHWGKGLASVLKQDKHFRDWTAGGGPISAFVSEDRPQLAITVDELTGKKSKGIKYAKNPLEALRWLSVALENTTRVGIYRAALEKGLTHAEAIKESRIGTLDFLRWGYNARVLNQIISFWNANVQGVDKMIRETTTEKERAHTWLRIAKGIIAPTVILWAINKDDERYKELPGWRKLLCWNIVCGKDGPIISLPKPWIAVGVMTEGFLNYCYERDPKALEATLKTLGEGLAPGYLPTALVPFIESEADYNFFLQRPIEGEALKRLPVSQRYRAWTPEIAKEVGKIFDVSPVKFENWVRSWAGGMGMYAMQLAGYPLAAIGVKPTTKLKEPILKRIPIIKGLIAREPIGSASESVNRFYENVEGIIQAEQGLRSLHAKRDLEGYKAFRKEHPEYRFAKRTRKTEKRLADLRSKKQRLYESDAPEEEKREKIKALNRRMTDIARAFNKWYGQKLEELKKQEKKRPAGEYVTGTWVSSYRQQANP